MRAKSQWRDRYGRWIEMGRGVKFKFRRHDGSVVSANGVFVGATDDPNVGQLYVSKDPNGLKDGFYNINSANAQEILASLDAGYLQKRGISLGQHADGTSIADRMAEEIPDEAALPFFEAPTGWKAVKNGPSIMNWVTDDNEFSVTRAPYNVAQKTGKQFILSQNGRSVASVKDWPEALAKVNEIDADPNNANNKETPKLEDLADAKAAANKANADKQAAFGDENADPKDRAKKAISEYDPEGTVGNLIDQGAASKDILDALDNNAAWKTRYQKYFRRGDIDLPTKLDQQDWADTEKRIAAIKGLDTAVPTSAVDRNTGHNLDLSVGDVAADGYLVPTQGNNETHDRAEFEGANAVAALADYVNNHKDALAGGGKRLSVTYDNENNKVVFDIVDQVPDHNEAQVLASQRGETDIFDVANSKVISVGESRDPNATGIPGNTGADQNNVSSPDANSGAEQSQQPDAGADHPVADAAGPGNAAEEQQRSDSGADNAQPAGGKPAEGTGAGPAEHSGDQPAQQQPAADAKPEAQPTDNAPAEQPSAPAVGKIAHNENTPADQHPSATAPRESVPAEADPGVAPLPAQAQEIVNPKDNLPDDTAQLQRMAMRLEARAALLQDSPAAHTIADTLDAIYAKLNGAAPEGSPEKPTPTEATSVRGKESSGAVPAKAPTTEKKAADATPVPEKAPAQDAPSTSKDAAPTPKSDATPADAPAEKPAPKADATDLRARLETKRKQVPDTAPAKPDAAPAPQVDEAPAQVDSNLPDAPAFQKGDRVQWADRSGKMRTGKVLGPNPKRQGWFNVALDAPKKSEADRYSFDGERLEKLDEAKAEPAKPDTPTQAEPAKKSTPEVTPAPEQASESTPAPEAAPAPEAVQPAPEAPAAPVAQDQPVDSIEQELADAQAAVRVAQRRLDAAQAAGKDLGPYQEDLQYANEDLRGLQRIAQRRAERANAPQDNAPQAPEAPQENAPEAPQADVLAENAPADAPVVENAPEGAPEASVAPEAGQVDQAEQVLDQKAAEDLANPETPDDQALVEYAREQADPEVPSQNPPVAINAIVNDIGDSAFQDDLGFLHGLLEENGAGGFDAVFNPEDANIEKAVFPNQEDAKDWLGDKIAQEAGSNVNSLTGAPVGANPKPVKSWQGENAKPVLESAIPALRNSMQGKDLTPEQQDRINSVLAKPGLTRGELLDARQEVFNAPNVAGGNTQPRDKASNPVNFTNASEGLLKPDANQIVDPNLIMADVKRNHPEHIVLPNGDVIIESRTVGNKTYDVVVRRTRRERFLTYVRETDNNSGVVRAARISNETHSYKALQTKINRAKSLIRSDNAEKRFRQRKNIENLPAGVDAALQNNIVQDLIDHVDGPRSSSAAHEAKMDVVKHVIDAGGAEHVLDAMPKDLSNARAADLLDQMAKKDGNDQAVKIIGSDGKEIPSHIPFGGGDPLKVNDWVDWTDTRLTVNGKTNPDYGKVFRGQVRQLRYKTNDGKYVYSDSTYVVFGELNARGGFKPSKQRARISSTLKKVDGQFAEPSMPFFPKKIEQRQQENVLPGKTPADFGVPEVDGGIQPRPLVPQAKELEPEVDIDGNAWVGSADNPVSIAEDNAGMFREAHNLNGGMFPANRVQPGDFIQITRPDDGMQVYAKIVKVAPGEDRMQIDYVHFDRNNVLLQRSMSVSNKQNILAWRKKGVAPLAPANAPEPAAVHFAPQKYNKGDVVFVADIPGARGEIISISAPNAQGERTYVVRADENGMEYSRLERYVDGNATGDLAMQAATIKPIEKQKENGWRKDLATSKQRAFIQSLADKKQLSPASQKQVRKALADENLSKGQASDLITELKNHKPRAERVNRVADEQAENVLGDNVAKNLIADPEAPVNGLDVKHALGAAEQAKQALDGAENDKYHGEAVKQLRLADLNATGDRPAFQPLTGVDARRIKVGDIIMEGLGDKTRHLQVLSQPQRFSRSYRTREIADPHDIINGRNDGIVRTRDAGWENLNILRPTGYAPKDYFKKGYADVEAANFFRPHADGTVPVVIQDYNDRAANLLKDYNEGWKPTRAINEGAINDGANFLELANGREVFQKAVKNEREYWNEILASKTLNALGVSDIVVVGLPDGKNLVQDKVDGKMAKEDWGNRAAIMGDPKAHPNFRLIGLLDWMFQNTDRHDGNWMINKDGQPVPIDHGYTWFGKARGRTPSATFAQGALGRLAGIWRNDPMFSQSELVALRENFKSLRGDFISAGHLDWYNYALRRLTNLINNY